jgi:hypothetical protein
MPQADRLATIHKAISDGDDFVTACVLEGPLLLSGLTAIERDNIRQKWARMRHPAEMQRIDQLERDADHLARSGALLISFQRKMSNLEIVAAAIAAAGAVTH